MGIDWTAGNYPEPGVSWLRRYGLAYYHRAMHIQRITLADPVGLKHVLVTHSSKYPRDHISRTIFSKMFRGTGLLSAHGAAHAAMRKQLNPHFTHLQLKSFVPIFELHATRFLKVLLTLPAQTPIDLHAHFTKLTLDIIGVSAFGYDFEAVLDSTSADLRAYDDARLPSSLLLTLGMTCIPFWEYLPFADISKRRRATDTLQRIVLRVIEAKMLAPTAGSSDLLDLLFASGPRLTPAEACVHVMTFLQAGHETTSNTLCWVLAMLAKHPAVADRVHAECKAVLERFPAPLPYEALSEVPYLTAVLQETLRCYPTVPALAARDALDDDTIPLHDGSTLSVPAGTAIWIDIVAIHRNPAFWTHPDAFLPERFLDGDALYAADKALRDGMSSTFFYLPFGAGDKNCIGQRFAMMEMQVILLHLLASHKFPLTKRACMHPKRDIATMTPVCLETTFEPHQAVAASS
ncbi:hypothetical protein SPRG_03218 [Saprolegnia parasitica CBS 223.65]|uniref:Cytochrome P450 n=1 Tax=Saprolegnia parasitica (strain CBS 223.65) TaxID=695850 RepID=A0A067CZP3_SAPPC|nr:hypothetical protein SPRG_03218 [Saprolegnia parasitica CBS 223.65]KDO32001.1 hypothetical protein SPRG_03218 [Saprolegnia parasitica CBS 223.65]|eukprot:XP_012197195.1 hypothetical protein SPRG_03218 [Saprolegnia parasitica CBS 223.65]